MKKCNVQVSFWADSADIHFCFLGEDGNNIVDTEQLNFFNAIVQNSVLPRFQYLPINPVTMSNVGQAVHEVFSLNYLYLGNTKVIRHRYDRRGDLVTELIQEFGHPVSKAPIVPEHEFEVLLLPLGTPALGGSIYKRENVTEAFELYRQQVVAGTALVEIGRPYQTTVSDRYTVDLNYVCARITDVNIRDTGVYGKFVLTGPRKDLLCAELEKGLALTPEFSMRSLVQFEGAGDNRVVKKINGFAAVPGSLFYGKRELPDDG